MRVPLSVLVTVVLVSLNSAGAAQTGEEGPTTSEANNQPMPLETSNNIEANPVIERSSHVQVHVDPHYKGFWAKKFAWRPRWVKTWQEKKIYVAVWKRMWGPLVVKEWVPVPKPPPGWVKHEAGSYVVKKFPHHH